jgi:hypothetical protein
MAEVSLSQKSRALKVMLLLIESGAVFCLLQIIYIPLTVLYDSFEMSFLFNILYLMMGPLVVFASVSH